MVLRFPSLRPRNAITVPTRSLCEDHLQARADSPIALHAHHIPTFDVNDLHFPNAAIQSLKRSTEMSTLPQSVAVAGERTSTSGVQNAEHRLSSSRMSFERRGRPRFAAKKKTPKALPEMP
uniref:Uncharacterized protein n=1 Tax=Physcomitrium patens TaxID=3218 RepID=A0A2K1KG00_PHYPA|nr:hypothetical protein PHYPA_009073 [Physcomitrium patens]